MNNIEIWKNVDYLTVDEFMCLVLGYEPGSYKFDYGSPKDWPEGAEIIYRILIQDIEGDKLILGYDTPADVMDAPSVRNTGLPWWHYGKIQQQTFRNWVKKRKIKSKFFETDASDNLNNSTNIPNYLNPKHPNYSFKLAIAIKAWEALTANPDLLKGKGCKDAVIDWLEDNIDLLDIAEKNLKNGQLSNNLKENISFIVNWNLSGGAPKTPIK